MLISVLPSLVSVSLHPLPSRTTFALAQPTARMRATLDRIRKLGTMSHLLQGTTKKQQASQERLATFGKPTIETLRFGPATVYAEYGLRYGCGNRNVPNKCEME